MTAKSVFLAVLLFSVGCGSYKKEKADARKIVDGGEWIVKYTNSDEIPQKVNPNGTIEQTTFISPCSVNCVDDESISNGFDIRIGKKTDPYDIGEEALCVHKSHPQYTEFVKLKRGDRIRFEYIDSPTQEKCIDEAMFIKLKR